jgi:hypothetical protein
MGVTEPVALDGLLVAQEVGGLSLPDLARREEEGAKAGEQVHEVNMEGLMLEVKPESAS